MLKKIFSGLFIIVEFFLGLLMILFLLLYASVRIDEPIPSNTDVMQLEREMVSENHYRIGNNWMRKNDHGIWEVYVEGEAFERGVIYGKLCKDQIQTQEDIFVGQIKNLIPNEFFRSSVKWFVAFFNRNIDDYVPEEYLMEIYGVSRSFADDYNFIGPAYQRVLNYHASHDIGHALQDLSIVGCTSFAVNLEKSEDSTLLIGRNFDFYMGEEFAQEKLVTFMNPAKGYKYMSYSWAGFMGAVSGMNEKGLTVTVNASKSEIPSESKDPISLLAREILQYASNIDEAIAICEKREIFVSESIMIGSAEDKRMAIIEKSPYKMGVYYPENVSASSCANHYQGETFTSDSVNILNIKNSDSNYRFERANELLAQSGEIDVEMAASILRNRKGVGEIELGMGNPRAINQLLAHHSVIFKPEQKRVWVTTHPYQLGEFICYNLDSVFSGKSQIIEEWNTIEADPFLTSKEYQDFTYFREMKSRINGFVLFGRELSLGENEIDKYMKSNPDSYVMSMTLGQYFMEKEDFVLAKVNFQDALGKHVASLDEYKKIEKLIKECEAEL